MPTLGSALFPAQVQYVVLPVDSLVLACSSSQKVHKDWGLEAAKHKGFLSPDLIQA